MYNICVTQLLEILIKIYYVCVVLHMNEYLEIIIRTWITVLEQLSVSGQVNMYCRINYNVDVTFGST